MGLKRRSAGRGRAEAADASWDRTRAILFSWEAGNPPLPPKGRSPLLRGAHMGTGTAPKPPRGDAAALPGWQRRLLPVPEPGGRLRPHRGAQPTAMSPHRAPQRWLGPLGPCPMCQHRARAALGTPTVSQKQLRGTTEPHTEHGVRRVTPPGERGCHNQGCAHPEGPGTEEKQNKKSFTC